MAILEVKPSKLVGEVEAPPSKSYTHRAFSIALLADGESQIADPLLSLDTRATIDATTLLGAKISRAGSKWIIDGTGGKLKPHTTTIDAHNSGTTIRFMTAIASLSPVPIRLTGDESIQKRPIGPLVEALQNLGVEARCEGPDGRPPVIVEGGGIVGGRVEITGEMSSQFISALLIACPYAREKVKLVVVDELHSRPYVDITLEMLEVAGANIRVDRKLREFDIKSKQIFDPIKLKIPGDFSSAAFLLGAAALTGSTVRVDNLDIHGAQGDKRILELLKYFGAEVGVKGKTVEVSGTGQLSGIEVDCGDTPDLVPILAVLGSVADGTTILTNIPHLRFKETDRLRTIATELRKMGAEVEELQDGLRLHGVKQLKGAKLKSYGDHRMVMAFAIAGLVAKGKTIVDGAENIEVSYPNFVEHMQKLGAQIELFD